MNQVPQLILDLLTISEYVLFVVMILNMRICVTINKRILPVLVIVGAYLAVLFYGVSFLITFWFLQAAIISIYYFLFHTALKELIKMWLISLLIISMAEIIVRQLIIVFGVWDDRFTERILCLIFIQCGLVLYYVLIGCKIKTSLLQLPIRMWILMIVLLALFVSMHAYLFSFIRYATEQRIVKIGILLTLFAGEATIILISLFVHYFSKMQQYQMQEQLSREYNEQQKEYFTQMLEKEQNTRRFRHDIVNHLLAIKGLCQKDESGDAEAYVADLLEEIRSISGKRYDVGNEIINIIINYYFVPLQEAVTVTVYGYIGEIEAVSQKDLCVLVSNLVKNSVEAVKDMEEARIIFTVRCGERHVCIELENSCMGTVAFDKNWTPKTNKPDTQNHGWGLKNVQEALRKYHGEIRYSVVEQMFKVEVYLPF